MTSDKSIFLFLKSFFWRKLYLISLLFVHYRVIWRRYFSLLDRLLRLFFIDCINPSFASNAHFMIRHLLLQQQSLYYFHMVHQSISSFEHFFLSFSFCYLSARFLSLLALESFIIFQLVSVSGCFLCLSRCCECWYPWIS